VDDGENPRQALHREVQEEIGLPPQAYEILESREGYNYQYSEEVKRRKRTSYRGQSQTYYLCRLRENAPPIDVHQRPREFRDFRWIAPAEFDLNWVPAFKRSVYRQVIRDFFGVEAGE
jgi:putative (di)nucleoside polyphosphate hydrolase